MPEKKTIVWIELLLSAILLIYAGHWDNQFHFDDTHTIVRNPWIRDIHNIPRFFTDGRTFSVRPQNRSYRPVVSASLAIDYWLGKGLRPFYFHLSTFFWFLLQIVLMYGLFRHICDLAVPDRRNGIVAVLAAGLYGIHPAMAETVNYIIQRGDLYSTIGPVAGLLIFAVAPRLRKYGLYLPPVTAALLSKPPAIVFPALLFVYIWLFETDEELSFLCRVLMALRNCGPAVALTALLGWVNVVMTPKEFHGGAVSAYAYRITQPLIALRYFRTFFLPGALSADTDFQPLPGIWRGGAWVGFIFVAVVIGIAVACAKRREWRPVSFGLCWFLLALLTTSIYPLAEVENDHRMFFPFVGLVLSVVWPVALWIYRLGSPRRIVRWGLAAVCALEFSILALGTVQRNRVWQTEESLWRDAAEKSPRNPRMNYAISLVQKGEPEKALALMERAGRLAPDYGWVEINLGAIYAGLKRDGAESHFRRGLQLSPSDAEYHALFAKWLEEQGRHPEAVEQLRVAINLDPDRLAPFYYLMQISAKRQYWTTVTNLSGYVLRRFPTEDRARAYAMMAANATAGRGNRYPAPSAWRTPSSLLELSALYYEAGKFEDSVEAARAALALRPAYPEAYNNISASSRSLGKWEQAIESARNALVLRPGYKSARQNLTAAVEGQKWSDQVPGPAGSAHGENQSGNPLKSPPAPKK